MGHMGVGPMMRAMRADRTVVDQDVNRRTLRRIATFAGPHRRSIALFIVLTVLDAAFSGLGVVTLLGVPDPLSPDTGIYSTDLEADCQDAPNQCDAIPTTLTRIPFGNPSPSTHP